MYLCIHALLQSQPPTTQSRTCAPRARMPLYSHRTMLRPTHARSWIRPMVSCAVCNTGLCTHRRSTVPVLVRTIREVHLKTASAWNQRLQCAFIPRPPMVRLVSVPGLSTTASTWSPITIAYSLRFTPCPPPSPHPRPTFPNSHDLRDGLPLRRARLRPRTGPAVHQA